MACGGALAVARALLDGGTVALSVTLLGYLGGKNPHALHSARFLISSWICLMGSMTLALARNWVEHDRVSVLENNKFLQSLIQWVESMANLANAAIGTAAAEIDEFKQLLEKGKADMGKQVARHGLLWRSTQIVGFASLALSVLGFVLLLSFAITNIRSF
jgi:hypothetical protein